MSREVFVIEAKANGEWSQVGSFGYAERRVAESQAKLFIDAIAEASGATPNHRVTRYIPAPEVSDGT